MNKSLAFKFSVFVVMVMAVAMVVLSFVFIASERSKLSADIIQSGESFANFSSQTIYDSYIQYYTHPYPEDFETFKTKVRAVLTHNADIVRVNLLGINGRILFDSDELRTGKYEGAFRQINDQETLNSLKGGTTSYRDIQDGGETVTEIIVPIFNAGSHLFSMRYLVSQNSLTGRMSEVYWQLAVVALPVLVFVIIMSILFTFTLTRPLKMLMAAAERLRGGNFDVKIELDSEDEIGRLARVFNEMVVKIKESHTILEEKVKQRTTELEKERGSLEKKIKQRTVDLEKLKTDLELTVAARTKDLNDKLIELDKVNKYMIGREMRMVEMKKEIQALKGGKEIK